MIARFAFVLVCNQPQKPFGRPSAKIALLFQPISIPIQGTRLSHLNRILVTEAAGAVGRHVISQLTAVGAPIRALARNPEAAGLPPEVEVRGDLTLPETRDARLEGIDTVFLVWVVPPATFAPVARNSCA